MGIIVFLLRKGKVLKFRYNSQFKVYAVDVLL